MDTAEKPAQSARKARPVASAARLPVSSPAISTPASRPGSSVLGPGNATKPAARPEKRVTSRVVVAMQGVTKSYPNGRVALRGVDLVIPEGDFVFLVGPSGAGKSTVIKLLMRRATHQGGCAPGRPGPGQAEAARRAQDPSQDRYRLPGLQASTHQVRSGQRGLRSGS